jgi:crotonobetainyl-CoA:carnitine CoA-transferase CaiB-like acyl-CoA transferase
MPCDRADYWGGLHGAAGTTLALVARLATGRGQHVDISSAESLNNYVNGHDTITYVDTGFVPRRRGHRVALLYPYTTLPCKDGYFGLIIANQHHWERFVELMGSPEWSKLPRYQDRLAMGSEYPDEVDALIVPWLRRYTKKELWAMCRARGIPFHPLQTIDEVMEWEQLKARAYWQRVRDDAGRDWTLPGPLFKMSRTPPRAFRPAPRLGEHTRDVLQGLLGMSGDDVEQLSTAGVI